jgi:2',3'-cyclic-nucleotide 2'-phosphodiesterase (5'-nucleotidase family)
MADTGKIKFTDPFAAIEAEITALYDQQVYFVIALGSAGFENAKIEWMGRAYNVDLFVNGQSR